MTVAIGSSPWSRYNLTGALAKRNFSVPGQDELVRRAELHRPEYLQAGLGVQFAERRISEQRSGYLPELNLFGSFGSSGPNWGSGSTDYSVGAGITLNLFEPGRASRVSQAQIQRSLAQADRDRVHDRIVVEVARAYHQYRAAIQQLEVAEAAMAQAAEALRITQDRYEAGLATITDLLRTETAMVRARLNVTSAVEAQYVSFANVLLAAGELNDVQPFES